MKKEIITCDVCNAEKKDAEWWSVRSIEGLAGPFTYQVARHGGLKMEKPYVNNTVTDVDLCSEICLQKYEFRLRDKMRSEPLKGILPELNKIAAEEAAKLDA